MGPNHSEATPLHRRSRLPRDRLRRHRLQRARLRSFIRQGHRTLPEELPLLHRRHMGVRRPRILPRQARTG